MTGSLEQLSAQLANFRDQAAAARARELRDRMRTISSRAEPGELPFEERQWQPDADFRGNVVPAARIVELVFPALVERPTSAADRLQELERELAGILAAAAPSTWSLIRGRLSRDLRAARREIRRAERSA